MNLILIKIYYLTERLFELFALEEITVNKRQLIDVISSFDLPLKIEVNFI